MRSLSLGVDMTRESWFFRKQDGDFQTRPKKQIEIPETNCAFFCSSYLSFLENRIYCYEWLNSKQ